MEKAAAMRLFLCPDHLSIFSFDYLIFAIRELQIHTFLALFYPHISCKNIPTGFIVPSSTSLTASNTYQPLPALGYGYDLFLVVCHCRHKYAVLKFVS